MKTTPSSPRVTSAGVIKGAMVQETYAAFRSWDFAVSKKENLDRIREENLVGAPTSKWLTNVLWNISSRFDPEGRDRPLVLLAQQGVSMDLWKPLLLRLKLLHMVFDRQNALQGSTAVNRDNAKPLLRNMPHLIAKEGQDINLV